MNFSDFLKKYYAPSQHQVITSFLIELNIYENIKSSINDYYQCISSKDDTEIIAQLVLSIREFVTCIYKPLLDNRYGDHTNIVKKQISELAIYLMKETYHFSGLESTTYLRLMVQISRNTYSKYSWDYAILENLLDSNNILPLSYSKKEEKTVHILKASKPIKLDWYGRQPLDFFIDDLAKTFRIVKGKRQLYQLFEEITMDFKIEMSSKYLLPFLTLFHDLHEYGTIKVIGNRGLFIYLHHRLQAPPNDKYPKRDFRKLRYDAKYNNQLNHQILAVIKPMLDKYCCTKIGR